FSSETVAAGTYLVYSGTGFTGPSDGALLSGVAADGAVGLRDASGVLIDSVAWGGAAGGFAEGGSAAPYPPTVNSPGNSDARIPNGADSDNNAHDFQVATTPTPRAPN